MSDSIYHKISKNTLLHHYVTCTNKNRTYRWYYLDSQLYNKTVGSNVLQIYRVKKDILLLEYQLPYIVNNITNIRVNEPGFYNVSDYNLVRPRSSDYIYDKNEFAKKNIPFITYESTVYDLINPVTEQYFVYKSGKFIAPEFELIIPNEYVELVEEKKVRETDN